MIFGYILIHRIYSQYSCNNNTNNHHILSLLQIAINIEIDSKLSYSLFHMDSSLSTINSSNSNNNAVTPSHFQRIQQQTNSLEETYNFTFQEFFSYFLLSNTNNNNNNSSSGVQLGSQGGGGGGVHYGDMAYSKLSAMRRVSPNNNTASNPHSNWQQTPHPLYCILLYESLQRLDIIQFLESLCKPLPIDMFLHQGLSLISNMIVSTTNYGTIGHEQLQYVDRVIEISSICQYLVDPIIQLLEESYLQAQIPSFLIQLLNSWKPQQKEDYISKKYTNSSSPSHQDSHQIESLHRIILAATIIPFVLKYLRCKMYSFIQNERMEINSNANNNYSHHSDDNYSWFLRTIEEDILQHLITLLLDKIRQVLLLAFGISTASEQLILSLSDSALLSKSKWTFNR